MLARLKTEREQDRRVEREGVGRIEDGGNVDHCLSAVGEQVLEMVDEVDFGGKEGIHFCCWPDRITSEENERLQSLRRAEVFANRLLYRFGSSSKSLRVRLVDALKRTVRLRVQRGRLTFILLI